MRHGIEQALGAQPRLGAAHPLVQVDTRLVAEDAPGLSIAIGEVVEATPKSIRLRKAVLDQTVRGRSTKRARLAG